MNKSVNVYAFPHNPHFPHSSFSILRTFHAPHFPHSAFSILLIFHTPHFPYSSFSTLRTPHSTFSIQPKYSLQLNYCFLLARLAKLNESSKLYQIQSISTKNGNLLQSVYGLFEVTLTDVSTT